MSTSSLTTVRRIVAVAAAACAVMTITACGTEVAPPGADFGGAGPTKPPVTATLADCLDTGRQPPVTTCPYPIKSGNEFAPNNPRRHVQGEHSVSGH